MLDSLSLKKKGYVLIVLPILFQIFFVLIILALVAQEQSAATSEHQSNQSIIQAHLLTKKLTETAVNHYSFKASKGLAGKRIGEKEVEEIDKQIDVLTELISKNTETERDVNKFRTSLKNFSKFVTEEDQSIYTLAKGSDPVLGNKMYRSLQEMFDSIKRVIDSQSESSAFLPETISQMRGRVHILLIFTAIANIFLAVFVVRTFFNNITSRLDTVVSKAERLAKREPIGDSLSGSDEISEIDKLVHVIDQEVEKSISQEKAVIANAADAIIVSDNQGMISFCNDAATRIFESSEEKLSMLSLLDLLKEEEVLTMTDNLSRLASGKVVDVSEITILKSGERTCPSQWSMYSQEEGKTVFSIVHDLSELKEVEGLKREFVSMISHDLRTPLTAIENSISVVLLEVFGPVGDQGRIELESAQRNANRLIKLINDFLDMEKLKSGRMKITTQPNQLIELVDHALEMVSGDLNKKSLTIEKGELDYTVVCDQDRIEQVLLNLLSNATNYSPENEVIKLMARRMNDSVQVLVVDRGPGIPEDIQEQIFNPYEQVNAKRETEKKGAGLGLSIAASIIKEHGCDIGVFSMLNHGSTFWFTLPVEEKNK